MSSSNPELNVSAEGIDTGGVETSTGKVPGTPERNANGRLTLIDIERPGNPDAFEPRVRQDALQIVARYPEGQSRSALLPMLHLVQSEQGYVSADGIAFCADVLDITKAQVAAVATFYTMYKRKPVGEYLVSVCTNTLCGMLGGDEIYASVRDELGVGMNETTPDGTFTLEHAECLAACDYAPVVTVNYEFFDNQDVASTRELLAQLRAGNRPQPTRGAPLCSFKEIERQIAGFVDTRPESTHANGTGTPTEAGVRLAQQRGESAPGYPDSEREANDRAHAPGAYPGSGNEAAEAAADNSGARTASSAHDAPLSTSVSDPAHSANQQGELFGKGE